MVYMAKRPSLHTNTRQNTYISWEYMQLVHNMGEYSILMKINLYAVHLTLAVTWYTHAGIALAGHSEEDWSPICLCPSMVYTV